MSGKRKLRDEKQLDDEISVEKKTDDDETSSKKKAVEGPGCILLHASWEPHIRETWNPATKKNIINDRFKIDAVLDERNKETVDEIVGLSQPLRSEMRNKNLKVGADNCAEEMKLRREVLNNVGDKVEDKLEEVESVNSHGNCNGNLEVEIQNVDDRNDKPVEKLIKIGDSNKEKLRNASIQLVKKWDKNDLQESTVEKIGIVNTNDSEQTNLLLNDGNNMLKLDNTYESQEDINLLILSSNQSTEKLKTMDELNGTDKLRAGDHQMEKLDRVDDSPGTDKLGNDGNIGKLDKVGDLKETDKLMEKFNKIDDSLGTKVLTDCSNRLANVGKVEDSQETEVYRIDSDDVNLLGRVDDSQETEDYNVEEVYNLQEMEFYRTGGDIRVNDLQGTTDLINDNNDSSEKLGSLDDREVELFRNDASRLKMLRKDDNEMASEEFSNTGDQYDINIDEMKTVINSRQSVELSANNNDSIGEGLMYHQEDNPFDNVGGHKEIPQKVTFRDALAELVIPIMEFENECESMEWGQMGESSSLGITTQNENSNFHKGGLTLEEVRLETGMKTSVADGHPNSSPSTHSCASSETLTDPELCSRELAEGVQDESNMNSVELADVVIVDENNSLIALEDAAKQSQDLSVREIEQAMGVGPGQAEGCVICKEGGQQFIIVNGELAPLSHVLGMQSNKKSETFDVGGQQYVLNENGEMVLFNDSRSSNAQVADINLRGQTSTHGETDAVDQSGHPTSDPCQPENFDPLFGNPEQSTVQASRGKATKPRGQGRRPGRPRGKWKRKSRAKANPGFLGPTQGLISRKERDEINNAVTAISEENNWHTNPKALNLSFLLEEESNSGLNFEKNSTRPSVVDPDWPPRNDYLLRPEFNDGKVLGPTQGLVSRKEREELNRIVKDDSNWYLSPSDESPCGSKHSQSILKDSDRKVMEAGSMMSAKIYNDWIQSTKNSNTKKASKQHDKTSTRKNRRNVNKVTETEESWMDSTKFKKATTCDELKIFENNNSDVDDPDPVEDHSAFHLAASEVNSRNATNNDDSNKSFSNYADYRGQSTSFNPSGDYQNQSSYSPNDGNLQPNYEKQSMDSSLPSYPNSYNYQSYPSYGLGHSSYGYQAHYNNNIPSGAKEDQPLLDLSQRNEQNETTAPYSSNVQSSESFMGQVRNNVSGWQDHQNIYNSEYNGQNVNHQNLYQQNSHQYGEGTNYPTAYRGYNPVYQQYLNDYYKAYSGACSQEQFQAMMKHWYNQGGGMYQRYYYNLYHQFYNYHYPGLYSQHGYYPPPSIPLISQENNFDASSYQSPNPEPNPEVTRGITSDESSPAKNDTENDREVCEAARDDEAQEILPNMKDEKTDSPWSMKDVVESCDSVESAEQNFGSGPAEFVFVDDSGDPQFYEDENSELASPTWDQTKVFARRKRLSYTKAMLDALLAEYNRCVYITQGARERLSNSLGISEDRILNWFKNQRMKDKLKEHGGRAGDFVKESHGRGSSAIVWDTAGRRVGDATEEEVDNEGDTDNYHLELPRKRVSYSSAMLDMLMQEYNRSMYLTPGARARLVSSLGLSEDRILTWFKNQRSKDKLRIEAQGRSDDHLGE